MANMISSGKSSLEQQLVRVVGQVTKEVTDEVVNKTAVASVNKLNKDIAKANEDAKSIINSLILSKKEYDSMLADTSHQMNNIHSMVKNYNAGIDTAMSKMLTQIAQQNKTVEGNIVNLNKRLSGIASDINSLCEKAVIQSSKDITKKVLQDSVVVELGKFSEEINNTKKAFSELLNNINEINTIQDETKTVLGKFDKYFTENIQNWSNNQKKIIAACLDVKNQLAKTDGLIENEVNLLRLVEQNINANLNSSNNTVINSINDTYNSTYEQFENLRNDNLLRDKKIEGIRQNINQRFEELENKTSYSIDNSKVETLKVVLSKYSSLKKWIVISVLLNIISVLSIIVFLTRGK